MAAIEHWAVGSDNFIDLQGVADEAGNLFGSTADVHGRVYLGESAIAGSDVNFSYQAAGSFSGVFQATAQLVANQEHRMVVTVTDGSETYGFSILRHARYIDI